MRTPRFDPSVDKASGYRTRSLLTLPLVDHEDSLVGVMQVLNKRAGPFDAYDEALATALAAQCAVALQRVRNDGRALIEGERMRQALEMARGRADEHAADDDAHSAVVRRRRDVRAAELTGGDTYDPRARRRALLVVLGDATGHGIAPALSVTQMHAMLRMAFRLGADLETAFVQVNDGLPKRSPTIASSPRSSACSILRRTSSRSTAAARGRCSFTAPATGNVRALQADELSARANARDVAAARDETAIASGRHPPRRVGSASTNTRTQAARRSAKRASSS
jgi:hypothetical protein